MRIHEALELSDTIRRSSWKRDVYLKKQSYQSILDAKPSLYLYRCEIHKVSKNKLMEYVSEKYTPTVTDLLSDDWKTYVMPLDKKSG